MISYENKISLYSFLKLIQLDTESWNNHLFGIQKIHVYLKALANMCNFFNSFHILKSSPDHKNCFIY